ncbi:MAG TPA: hypothetical protein DHW19_07195, partial [Acidimicrobiaceae bacterium]|nr:hypothetical protein [Acidimicrobiaceae bacterium]
QKRKEARVDAKDCVVSPFGAPSNGLFKFTNSTFVKLDDSNLGGKLEKDESERRLFKTCHIIAKELSNL